MTFLPVCDRSKAIREKIVSQLKKSCDQITLKDLQSIKRLSIRGGGFKSLKSGDFSGLNELKDLDMSWNYLGTFPLEILNLTNLEKLNMNGVGFYSIPPGIGKLKKLKDIRVMDNELSHFPAEFYNLEDIEVLLIGENNFKTLPSEIGNFKKLRRINLVNNPIEKIHPEFKNVGIETDNQYGVKITLNTEMLKLMEKSKFVSDMPHVGWLIQDNKGIFVPADKKTKKKKIRIPRRASG